MGLNESRARRSAGPRASAGAAGEDDPEADPESVARSICLALLAAQPRTRAQLANALRRRQVPEEAAEAVLARFSDVGLVDDHAFAAAWVQSRHQGRGLARRALAAELRQRGVAVDDVGAAVCLLDDRTERETARGLVARRLSATKGLPYPVRARRLAGMLARKGYPPGVALAVVREALAGEEPADEDAVGWDSLGWDSVETDLTGEGDAGEPAAAG